MKNFFLILLTSVLFVSCEKNTLQQTTDNIKRADSLFTKANQGIQTLDSISKTISDSNGIAKKVIIPEIQKQKKSIDSTIKSGGWRIDSINKQIERITKNVVVGTEVAKTLDSANTSLQNGENALKVLTRTADKLLKQTKKQSEAAEPAKNKAETAPENYPTASTPAPTPLPERNPLVKTATLEIQVEDLAAAQAILRQKIRENNADLVSDNFSQNEGIQRQRVTAKVPLQYFDRFVSDISSNLGDIKSKNTETEGSDYVASQYCDVEIVLAQNQNIAAVDAQQTDEQPKDEGFSAAFMKGFNMLGAALLFLLPFWPVLVIGGLIWYFIHRKNQRKRREQTIAKAEIITDTTMYPTENRTSSAENPKPDARPDDDTDYSKYMPK